MQTYPAFTYLPNIIFLAANSKSALESTTAGLLPPNSNTQGTRFLAAAAATSLPLSELPVYMMLSNFLLVKAIAT
jgi:hypothetical protein